MRWLAGSHSYRTGLYHWGLTTSDVEHTVVGKPQSHVQTVSMRLSTRTVF